MISYFLFFYDRNIKDLLLEELKLYHPKLNLSFSNKSFLSMKGPEGYEKVLSSRPVVFSRRQAIFIGKVEREEEGDGLFYVKVKEGEFWKYKKIESPCDDFDLIEIDLPELAPARAYHKIREASLLHQLDFKSGDQAIEIGSAPGGISYYLLEKGLKLVSIDPANMSDRLFKVYGNNFQHLKKSIFDVERNELPHRCDWIISDLNLDGALNIKQSLRIMKLFPKLKGAFLTVKTPKNSDLMKFSQWKKEFEEFGDVILNHLPSHRKEIGIIIKKK